MSDIELPDFGANNLGLELEKGVFLRKKTVLTDTAHSSDSGNNSISTNASVGSTASSNSKDLNNGTEDQASKASGSQHDLAAAQVRRRGMRLDGKLATKQFAHL